MLLVAAIVGAALALAPSPPPDATFRDPTAAVVQLKRAIVVLPKTAEYDDERHMLVLRLGSAMLQTGDLGYAIGAQRMLLRYRERHERMFGMMLTKQGQRREIDVMLARSGAAIAASYDHAEPTMAAGVSIVQSGFFRAERPTTSLAERLRLRALTLPAFQAVRSGLRHCYARAMTRSGSSDPTESIHTTVALTVAPNGGLVSTQIVGSPLVDEAGNACVAAIAEQLAFVGEPSFPGMTVRIPLVFRWEPWRHERIAVRPGARRG